LPLPTKSQVTARQTSDLLGPLTALDQKKLVNHLDYKSPFLWFCCVRRTFPCIFYLDRKMKHKSQTTTYKTHKLLAYHFGYRLEAPFLVVFRLVGACVSEVHAFYRQDRFKDAIQWHFADCTPYYACLFIDFTILTIFSYLLALLEAGLIILWFFCTCVVAQ
jgi:hypothetical protein